MTSIFIRSVRETVIFKLNSIKCNQKIQEASESNVCWVQGL